MAPQAPWSPTAHAFAQHQFSHVVNFWKQGRHASFRMEALPSGRAELNLTFQLPPASEVVPPPSPVFPAPAPQRTIHPLFPKGFFPQRSGVQVSKPACQKKPSSKQRKGYRRSVLHRAALAAPSLPPPKNGSLRQAALVSVQRLQADSASPVNTQRKRSYSESDSPSAHSPSNFPPLAQRIRSDLQIGEESPEREQLRTQLTPLKSPCPSSPRAKGFPPPAPLAFTPPKIQEGFETPVTQFQSSPGVKEIPLPAPLVFNIQEDTEVEMLEKSNDELLEKSKDAEESGTESATSENDDSEAVKTAVDAIDLEGGLEAVKERIRLLQSLWKEMRKKELEGNPCD